MDALHWLRQGDAVTQATALLLLAMSVASWMVILWKLRFLQRTRYDLPRCTAAFWQAPDWATAQRHVAALDREALFTPLVSAAHAIAHAELLAQPPATLAGGGSTDQQITRALRNALHTALGQLQFGQVLLATVGSTAPFVGLLGTVWGIYHALTAIASAGQISIDKVAGPVGEALIMTAAGLAVAIPAVLAYNAIGRWVGRIEADLEGFAHDLRGLVLDASVPAV